jgi:hypothetical protein
MSDAWALRLLRWTFCVTIAWASAETLREGLAERDLHAQILAGLELPAIAAFAWPRLEIVAGVALLIIFAAASFITALDGQVPMHLVFYAVVAVYIVAAHRRTSAANTGSSGSVA